MDLPEGTVTFLFTDIESSTQLLHRLREGYAVVLADQRRILREAFANWHGHEVDTQGDAFFVAFSRATQAVGAAVEAQRKLAGHSWPEGVEVRVRMGIHTGEPWSAEEGYVGMDVHRAARIAYVCHGGQVLLSETTAALVQDELPPGVSLADLGRHLLRDIHRPERISQLVIEGLPSEFPPLTSLETLPEEGARRPRRVGACPYRGLAAFQEADAPFYFGRETFVDALEQAVRTRQLVAVIVGSSGSGKSSALFAGLLPRLRKSGGYQFAIFRPGGQPFYAMAGALLPLLEPGLSETDRLAETRKLAERLVKGEISLAQAAGRILEKAPDIRNILLVVDQFEELYTLCPDTRLQRAFIDELLATVEATRSQRDASSAILLTLRADFMGQALAHRPFADALQEASLLMGPMTRQELHMAIEKPAEIPGAAFEPGLVERILDDVGEKPGNLPLLEFTLTQLWEQQSDGWLTHANYEAMGGVEGALSAYADHVYADLEPDEQVHARRALVQLVQPGEGTEDTRRIATREELGDDSWSLVQRLADRRLVVTGRDAAGRETAEVVHEALIQKWRRFQEWMSSDRAFRLWQERLRSSLRQWQESGEDKGALLAGAPLVVAQNWLAEWRDHLSPSEYQYIEASLAEREAQRVAEEARTRREVVLEGRVRGFLRLLVVVFLLATMGSLALAWTARRAQIFAEGQSQARATQQAIAEAEANGRATQQALAEAEANTRATAEAVAVQEKDKAQQQADLATSRELAVTSINNLEVDPERSILLALYALRTAYTRQAEDALHLAIQTSRVRMALTGGTGGMRTVEYSPDGTTIATADYADEVTIWEADSGQKLFNFPGQVARYSPDGKRLATGSQDGTVVIWDLASRQKLLTLKGHNKEVEDVHFSPDGKLLVSSSLDNTFIVWDTETGRETFSSSAVVASDTLYNVAFSPDGKLLVSIDFYDPEKVDMKVWGVDQDWTLLNQIPGHSIVVPSLDGRWLAASGGEQLNGIYLWDLSKLSAANLATLNLPAVKPILVPAAHGTLIVSLGFSPDGKLLATSGLESTAKVWQISPDGLDLLMTLSGHTKIVGDVAFSPDGTRVATASQDGTVMIWDITPAGNSEWFTIAAHTDKVFGLNVTADGRYLATASLDGSAKVWDLASGRELVAVTGGGSQLRAVAISLDGTRLATAGSDNLARVWKLDLSPGAASAELLHTLSGHGEGPPVGGLFPGLTTVAFSPDGTKLATGGSDGMAKVWDTQTGKELLSVQAHPDGRGITRIVFSPDGRLLATATDESPTGTGALAKIWDVSNGHEISTFSGHSQTGRIWGLAFGPDGKRVATGGWGGLLKIWDASTGQELLNLAGHTSTVTSVVFSPDGKYLATASVDGTARVWDAATGEELRSYTSPSGPLLDVAFTPDGKKVIASSGQGFVYGYVFDLDELIPLANSRLTRWFTLDECRQFLHREDCPTR